MRLQGKSTPDAMDAHTAQATMFGHRTDTPVGGLAGDGLQCQCDHPLHLSVVNGAWSSRTRLIEQSIEALANKAAAPFSHTLLGQAHPFSDSRVRLAAHKTMIRARCAKACAVLGRRAHCSNVPRSSGLKINAGIGRPVRMSVLLSLQLTSMDQDLFNKFRGQDTR